MLTGEELRLLRTLRGLKQKTMAERLHISQPAYSKLEKRKVIKGERLKQILEALDEKPTKIINLPNISN